MLGKDVQSKYHSKHRLVIDDHLRLLIFLRAQKEISDHRVSHQAPVKESCIERKKKEKKSEHSNVVILVGDEERETDKKDQVLCR